MDVQRRRAREHGVRSSSAGEAAKRKRGTCSPSASNAIHGRRHGRSRRSAGSAARRRPAVSRRRCRRADAEDQAGVCRVVAVNAKRDPSAAQRTADGRDRPSRRPRPGRRRRPRRSRACRRRRRGGRPRWPTRRETTAPRSWSACSTKPPGSVEAEYDHVELFTVVVGDTTGRRCWRPSHDRVVRVLVRRVSAPDTLGRRAARSCRAEPGSVVTTTDASSGTPTSLRVSHLVEDDRLVARSRSRATMSMST